MHRRLYESESLQEIDLKWFLEDLCSELRRGGLSRGRTVELVVEAPRGDGGFRVHAILPLKTDDNGRNRSSIVWTERTLDAARRRS